MINTDSASFTGRYLGCFKNCSESTSNAAFSCEEDSPEDFDRLTLEGSSLDQKNCS
eukprot:CAMPEP_0176443528 /NCGR_PEP_ID=MMETSP0127-20121128/22482_1 /TAXON_ID=938130 /ORGANISM="Platyophrya macrostoma, Strain WH" /LENGTH=55 /DNA_ID=CAMNT_0017828785 /DNA_START=92 /DNA_END=255 /DNA_ORIENTATION=+